MSRKLVAVGYKLPSWPTLMITYYDRPGWGPKLPPYHEEVDEDLERKIEQESRDFDG